MLIDSKTTADEGLEEPLYTIDELESILSAPINQYRRKLPDVQGRVLLACHRLKFISTAQAATVAGLSVDYMNREILKDYVEEKVIKKVVPEKAAGFGEGRNPDLYALTKIGYDYLTDLVSYHWGIGDGSKPIGKYRNVNSKIKWGKGGRKHRLALNDCLLAVHEGALATKKTSLLEVIPEYRPWGGMPTPAKMFFENGLSHQSDAVLKVSFGELTWPVAFELDCGTESNESKAKPENSIAGKGIAYWTNLKQGVMRRQFECSSPGFQVLFVTTLGAVRLKNMAKAIRNLNLEPLGSVVPKDVFFFSTYENAVDGFFKNEWLDVDGDPVTIIPGE